VDFAWTLDTNGIPASSSMTWVFLLIKERSSR
jgi:hypothetical protein